MNVQTLPMLRFIDHEGVSVNQLPAWADLTTLTTFYKDMVLTRTYDNKAVALTTNGQTWHLPFSFRLRSLWRRPSAMQCIHEMSLFPTTGICPQCGFVVFRWKKTFNIGVVMNEAATFTSHASKW